MARLFSQASGTDRVGLGSPAALDDLPLNNDYTLIVCVGRRTADNTGVLAFYGKSSSLVANGISFWCDNSQDPFTTYGHLRAVVGTDGAPFIRASGSGDTTTDTMVLNQQEVVACQFNAGFTSGFKFYRAPIDTWITEVSSYTNESSGTGTIGADAATDAEFGRAAAAGAFPFTGDLGFCLVYSRDTTEYSVSDIQRIQSGIWSYLYAVQTGGSTSRAVTIWQSVSGYKLLGYLSSAGTFTDHSGNSITGTLTGTSAGTDDPDWFVPTLFDDDIESVYSVNEQEQTDYRYTSSHARKSFTTTATGGTVLFYRTLDGAYDDQGVIGLLVNGAYTDTLVSNGSTGRQRDTFSGLAGSSKTLTLQNGVRSTPTGTRPYEGTFLVAVKFNAGATEIAPTTRTRALVNVGDSVLEGFLLNPPQEDAPLQQLRISGFSPTYDGVISIGAGGLELFDIAGDSTKRAEYAAVLTTGNPKRILFQLAANDKLSDRTLANFTTWLDTICDDIQAIGGFTGKITLATVTNWAATPEAATNGNGDVIEDFRQAIRDVVTSQGTPRVALCEIGDGLLDPTTDLNADGIHLNITGANILRPVYQDFTSDLDAAIAAVVADRYYAQLRGE